MRFLTVFLILIILLSVVAHISNPNVDDFESFIKTQMEKEIGTTSDNGDILSWIFEKVVDVGIRAVTSYKDYKFFSIFHVDLPGEEYDTSILGVFGVFIPLE